MNVSIAKRRAVTLAEMAIGIIIVSIIFLAVFNLFSVGLRGSNKGMAHLTIMEGSAILLSQIEYDLLRATQVQDPAPGAADKAARWEILLDDASGKGTIMYTLTDEGVVRNLDVAGTKYKYVYCRGQKVGLQFHHVKVADAASSMQKVGVWVELSVEAPEKFATEEKFNMKRLFICKNILDSL